MLFLLKCQAAWGIFAQVKKRIPKLVRNYMAKIGRKGGRISSPKKRRAARKNSKLSESNQFGFFGSPSEEILK